MGPLAGVRILDLTTVVMGPAATQILGDLGADVIKIENPGGDSLRGVGPFRHPGMGPMYLQNNRNKRSVVLNLKEQADREALLELARDTDVLVTNIRPQALQRLGLTYEAIQEVNPGVIFCTAVGYGTDGPYAGKAVYDDLMQSAAGIAGLFGAVDGMARYAPVNICDRVVGLYLVISILSALHHRQATGLGQEVEVPMFETMAQFVLGDHLAGRVFEPSLGPMGYMRLMSRTRGPYVTKDGCLSLVLYSNAHWRDFSAMVGQPGLLDTDERFMSQESRTINADAVGAFIAEHMPSRTTAEWVELLSRADIPVESVNSIESLFDDPHLQAVKLFEQREHPTEGTLNVTRFPTRFSRTPASIRRLPPNLGEHTQEVLDELRRKAARSSAQPPGATSPSDSLSHPEA